MSYILSFLRKGKNASFAVGSDGELSGRFCQSNQEFIDQGAKIFTEEEARDVHNPQAWLNDWLKANGLVIKGAYSAYFVGTAE